MIVRGRAAPFAFDMNLFTSGQGKPRPYNQSRGDSNRRN
jgi:hypothetical protein